MAIYIVLILVLPLFPAHPKLAPIYHPVDHMVAPAFPLLLIVPAAAIDALGWLASRYATRRSRASGARAPSPAASSAREPLLNPISVSESAAPAMESGALSYTGMLLLRRRWWEDWVLALVVAGVFLSLVLAVQWPFSGFLLSD